MKNLVKYIFEEHRYISSATRQLKAIDPRVLLAPYGNGESEVELLKLAHASQPDIFRYLWDAFPDLYTFQHLLDLGLTDSL